MQKLFLNAQIEDLRKWTKSFAKSDQSSMTLYFHFYLLNEPNDNNVKLLNTKQSLVYVNCHAIVGFKSSFRETMCFCNLERQLCSFGSFGALIFTCSFYMNSIKLNLQIFSELLPCKRQCSENSLPKQVFAFSYFCYRINQQLQLMLNTPDSLLFV